MKQVFEDGSVLLTGPDMMEALRTRFNNRNNFDRDCDFCTHDTDSDHCDGCSIPLGDGCSCHINPPCSYCVDSNFEPSEYPINYKHYRDGGKWKWECFKSDKEVFDLFTAIEDQGIEMSVETLSTGAVAIYLDHPFNEDMQEIELCDKNQFKETSIKMIKSSEFSK